MREQNRAVRLAQGLHAGVGAPERQDKTEQEGEAEAGVLLIVSGTIELLTWWLRQADPLLGVNALADKSAIQIGRDNLQFRLKSSQSGYVYVFLAGTDKSHMYLLFPNAIDRDNRIEAGRALQLPRPSWRIRAGGPAGEQGRRRRGEEVVRVQDVGRGGARGIAGSRESRNENNASEGRGCDLDPPPTSNLRGGAQIALSTDATADLGSTRAGALLFAMDAVRAAEIEAERLQRP